MPRRNARKSRSAGNNGKYQEQLPLIFREAALLVSVAFTLYLLVALISYSPSDPGWSGVDRLGEPDNLLGSVGAWFADVLLSLFGYVGFAIPWLIFYGGLVVFRGRQMDYPGAFGLGVRLVSLLAFLLSACGLSSLHFGVAPEHLPQGNGGILGYVVAEGLVAALNPIGTTWFLLTVFIVSLSIGLGFSWLTVMDYVGGAVLAFWRWSSDWAAYLRERYREWQTEQVEIQKPAPPPKKKAKQRKEPKLDDAQLKLPISEGDEPEVPAYVPGSGKELPPLELLDEHEGAAQSYSDAELTRMSAELEQHLADFGVEAKVVAVEPGPVITRFELDPAPGVKVSQISNLSKDLARAMSTTRVRVVEVIPGKSVIGLEIPNHERELVPLREILESNAYDRATSPITLSLGKDIGGVPVVAQLSRMPHLLVAGTTGSGKSVAINSMVLSMLYKATAEQVKLIMIDPKMLELSVYEGIPHLLAPVVTDMKEAANALRWCVGEMERRYRLMAAVGVRNLAGYNRKVQEAIDKNKPLTDPLVDPDELEEGEEAPTLEPLPLIVVIVDELADLMIVVGKKIEELIARLAQKARASGIHLILATQRPSADVITGLIKANIPTRICFQVASRTDSRVVLDQNGGEALLGDGDMLYLPPGTALPERVHGAFVDDHEVHKVVAYLKQVGHPDYHEDILAAPGENGDEIPGLEADDEADPLYDQAVAIVTESRKASISWVQRRLRVGYNRAARMVEQMEADGVVGPMEGGGQRDVLAPPPPED